MPFEVILILVAVGTYFAVLITALLLHGTWVAPFMERHGVRTAGFVAHWILEVGLIRDYLAARRLCRQQRIKPPWMKWFSRILLTVAIIATGIAMYILTSFASN